MADDWSIDAGPEFAGNVAGVPTGPGVPMLKRHKGLVGGSLLSEIRQRGNGAGSSTVVFPQGFDWERDGAIVGTIANGQTYYVTIVDVGVWDTLDAIAAEVAP